MELGTVSITKQMRKDGEAPAPTKTRNMRSVTAFASTFEPVRTMLARRQDAKPTDPLFVREDGTPVTRSYLMYHWRKAREAAGLPQFHIHHMRHTGLTIAEGTGKASRTCNCAVVTLRLRRR